MLNPMVGEKMGREHGLLLFPERSVSLDHDVG